MKWDPSNQSVAWFRNEAKKGTIDLAASIQRRPVWRLKQRCYLIESILLDALIPEIFIHRKTTAKGEEHYTVVDGQQRIRTILKFIGLDSDKEDNGFSLIELEEDSPFYGKAFAELDDETKKAFFAYSLSVRFLATRNAEEIRDMFMRLNRFLSPLKPQELRNARYTGALIVLATELANDNYFAKNGIVTPATIRRMGDIEFVSELILGCMYGPQDGSPLKIDEAFEEHEQYRDQLPDETRVKGRYEATLGIIQRVFPELEATRWCNKHDFYSLFVAVAHLLREGRSYSNKKKELAKVLGKFTINVSKYIEDEDVKVPPPARRYARAVQKGPQSKGRRGVRHQELLKILDPFFTVAKRA